MNSNCSLGRSCLAWAALILLNFSALAQDISPPDLPAPPVVSLELVERDAMETRIDQNAIFWAEFRMHRTGPATNDLFVFLNTQQGSARLGEDYWLDGVNNGSNVRFPAGASSVNVRLYPIDDDFYEGDETVFFHLIAPPPGNNPYEIDFEHSSVAMVIHDNDPVATRLDITSPHDGQVFQPGDTIMLRAQILGPGSSNSWSIEFFAGDQRLGTTQPDMPIWWGDAWGGPHVITARATNPQGTVLTSAPPVTIQVGPGAVLPIVKIGANPSRTGEPCPTCFVAPCVLTIERTAPTNAALTVFLEIDGTATPGDDYQALPASVEIPAGRRSAQLTLLARDDQLAEGPEVVRVRVLPQPPPLQPPTYFVSIYAKETLLAIFDDEPGAPPARLDIIGPTNGSHLRFPSTIQLSALAVNTQNEVYGPVEFYAGDQLVARSQVTATTRPAIPGLPSVHIAYWTNPPVGQYVLTARTRLSFSQSITSPPVNVTVDSPMLPVVRLETFPLENPQAREFCPPNADCAYPSFVVRRSGPTDADLSVYLSYSGTATAGADYPSLPGRVVIPAGRDATFLMLVPNDDTLVEGPETVMATFTPVPAPYIQDPNHASATITIIDDTTNLPPTVRMLWPTNGESFLAHSDIGLVAFAQDREDGYFVEVEFFEGTHSLGHGTFNPSRCAVCPNYGLVWSNVPPGTYDLRAKATDSQGAMGVSAPVQITVIGTNIPPETNVAVVTIVATDAIAVEGPFCRSNWWWTTSWNGSNWNISPASGDWNSPAWRTNNCSGTNTAAFSVRRTGPTNTELTVYYAIAGTASNGMDYIRLSGQTTIAAGQRSARVEVIPMDDSIREHLESVILRVHPPSAASNTAPTYVIGSPRQAAAVILDNDQPRPPCRRLPDGLFHLCAPGTNGHHFVVRASTDLMDWTVLGTNVVTDGAVHFIDPDAPAVPTRFYQVSPEPSSTSE